MAQPPARARLIFGTLVVLAPPWVTHQARTAAQILTSALLWWPVKRQSSAKTVIPRDEKALQYSGEVGSATDSQKCRMGVCQVG
jgi:hypothetical protein